MREESLFVSTVVSPRVDGAAVLDEQAIADRVEFQLRCWIGGGQGLLETACLDALFPTGKLLRPKLCMWSASAAGGDGPDVAAYAAGLECLHVASLVHDDIVDRAAIRRGRMSTAEHYGIGEALLAGDNLVIVGYTAMLDPSDGTVPAERRVRATRIAFDAIGQVVRAVMRETLVRQDLTCPEATVWEIIAGKTASLTSAACQGGAVLAGAAADHVEALRAYGEHLGTAFQIRDDLLPYTTTSATALSDVANRQPTLPVVIAHRDGTESDREVLRDAFRTAESDPITAHRRLSDVLTRTGAVEHATRLARSHAEQARTHLSRLPASPSRDRLAALADHAVERDR